jgi:hypothetical protein
MNTNQDLHLIPITVLGSWVKGHYSGPDKDFKYTLNQQADAFATNINDHSPSGSHMCAHPLQPPNYKIHVL